MPGRDRLPCILVVDDDADLRDFLALLLEDEGYRVALAADGAAALTAFDRVQPDLVLTDLQMPHMSGEALCAALQARAPRVPVVLMSAGLDPRRVAADHGAAGWLAKPFDLEALLRLLRRLLGSAHDGATLP
jgi:CheY-like chemotaxis protein